MKLAIMQPYLFPYIGYFQLIASCDEFVIYDDVQYIKGGWINRNRLLSNGKASYFVFRVNRGSSHDLINQKTFTLQIERDKEKFRKSLHCMYGKAPYFGEIYTKIDQMISIDEINVSKFVGRVLVQTCEFLELPVKFHWASQLGIPKEIYAQERVLWVNEKLDASCYINMVGGEFLYQNKNFASRGIDLRFLRADIQKYKQFGTGFIPGLSIIDVMMFNSRERVREMLEGYMLV